MCRNNDDEMEQKMLGITVIVRFILWYSRLYDV